MNLTAYRDLSPAALRERIRQGEFDGPTAGLANGYAQANLMIVRRELAYDFLLFCQRNPKPCPLLDVTDPGSFEPRHAAPGADIRTDFPRYRIYRNGELDQEVQDITPFWEDDMVAFLIGCSFTFETGLQEAGIEVRHIADGCNVPMYRTSISAGSAGRLHGPTVVSMRPLPGSR